MSRPVRCQRYPVDFRILASYLFIQITLNSVSVASEGRTRKVDLYSERKEMTLEDLVTPWAQYEFRLQAVNEIGSSAPSEPSPRTNIPSDRPYLYPSNVGGGGGKIGDLTITWTVCKLCLAF